MFLINSKNELAVIYNDKSVLENHHISFTFKLMSEHDCEIFENLNNTELKDVRKKMIQMVLGTDLAVHFYELGNFRGKVRNMSKLIFNNLVDEGCDITEEDKNHLMANCLHFADVSNQTKKWDVMFKWTEFLYDEFWNQVLSVLNFREIRKELWDCLWDF
jgi:hypothetical protein